MNLPALFPDIVIPTTAPHTTLVVKGELQARVSAITQQMIALPEITDNDSFQGVREVVKMASALKREVEASRQLANGPFNAVIQAINTAAKGVIAQLDAVITEGKQQETAFLVEQQRKQAEEAERIRKHEEEARKDQSRPTAALPITALPQAIDAPLATRPDIEITDELAIPREFLMVDMVKLRRAVLAEGRDVPGVKKVIRTQVVAR